MSAIRYASGKFQSQLIVSMEEVMNNNSSLQISSKGCDFTTRLELNSLPFQNLNLSKLLLPCLQNQTILTIISEV